MRLYLVECVSPTIRRIMAHLGSISAANISGAAARLVARM